MQAQRGVYIVSVLLFLNLAIFSWYFLKTSPPQPTSCTVCKKCPGPNILQDMIIERDEAKYTNTMPAIAPLGEMKDYPPALTAKQYSNDFRNWEPSSNSDEVKIINTISFGKNHHLYRRDGDRRLVPTTKQSVIDGFRHFKTAFKSLWTDSWTHPTWCPSFDHKTYILEIKDGTTHCHGIYFFRTTSPSFQFHSDKCCPFVASGKILTFKKLAVISIVVFDGAFGHHIDTWSHLMMLWEFVPADVTILVPWSARIIIPDMIKGKVLKERHYVIAAASGTSYHAELMYLVHIHHTPHFANSVFGQYLLARKLQLLVPQLPGSLPSKRDYILVIKRPGKTRKLVNDAALTARLQQEYPQYDVINEDIQKYGGFLEQGKIWGNAKMIISPHAGGFSNIMWTREDAVIVEIGYVGGGDNYMFPEEYNCACRNIGRNYILLIAPDGSYYGSMTVNVEDAVTQIKEIFNS